LLFTPQVDVVLGVQLLTVNFGMAFDVFFSAAAIEQFYDGQQKQN
jgi:hypothetical protein